MHLTKPKPRLSMGHAGIAALACLGSSVMRLTVHAGNTIRSWFTPWHERQPVYQARTAPESGWWQDPQPVAHRVEALKAASDRRIQRGLRKNPSAYSERNAAAESLRLEAELAS